MVTPHCRVLRSTCNFFASGATPTVSCRAGSVRARNGEPCWQGGVEGEGQGPAVPFPGPNNKLTIVYNANASWTSSSALGELVYNGGDMTTYQSYTKRGPVFSSANGLYGTGGVLVLLT